MFNYKKLFKLQIKPPSLILLNVSQPKLRSEKFDDDDDDDTLHVAQIVHTEQLQHHIP